MRIDLDDNKRLLIKDFLSLRGVEILSLENLDGMIIERDSLLSLETYKKCQSKIIELKSIFSSSYHTSMQNGANKKQVWPLLNMLRQVLRSIGYKLEPVRMSAGYNADGKKQYRRIFKVCKEVSKGLIEEISNEEGE